jgi:hypothetical protein
LSEPRSLHPNIETDRDAGRSVRCPVLRASSYARTGSKVRVAAKKASSEGRRGRRQLGKKGYPHF